MMKKLTLSNGILILWLIVILIYVFRGQEPIWLGIGLCLILVKTYIDYKNKQTNKKESNK